MASFDELKGVKQDRQGILIYNIRIPGLPMGLPAGHRYLSLETRVRYAAECLCKSAYVSY
jgi:hypothetical protein